MLSYLPSGRLQVFDNNGNPLAFGSIQFYNLGTTSPKAVYLDVYGNAAAPNPVDLDDSGCANIYLFGAYTFFVYDKNNNQIDSVDWQGNGSDIITSAGGSGFADNNILVVNNYASVRALTDPYAYVAVQGRLTQADGGQGIFYLNQASSDADDDFATLAPNTPGRYIRLDMTYLDPRWGGLIYNNAVDQGIYLTKSAQASVRYALPIVVDGSTYLNQNYTTSAYNSTWIFTNNTQIVSTNNITFTFANGTELLSCGKNVFGNFVQPIFQNNVTDTIKYSWMGASNIEGKVSKLLSASPVPNVIEIDENIITTSDFVMPSYTSLYVPNGSTSAYYYNNYIANLPTSALSAISGNYITSAGLIYIHGTGQLGFGANVTIPAITDGSSKINVIQFDSLSTVGNISVPLVSPEFFSANGTGNYADDIPVYVSLKSGNVNLQNIYLVSSTSLNIPNTINIQGPTNIISKNFVNDFSISGVSAGNIPKQSLILGSGGIYNTYVVSGSSGISAEPVSAIPGILSGTSGLVSAYIPLWAETSSNLSAIGSTISNINIFVTSSSNWNGSGNNYWTNIYLQTSGTSSLGNFLNSYIDVVKSTFSTDRTINNSTTATYSVADVDTCVFNNQIINGISPINVFRNVNNTTFNPILQTSGTVIQGFFGGILTNVNFYNSHIIANGIEGNGILFLNSISGNYPGMIKIFGGNTIINDSDFSSVYNGNLFTDNNNSGSVTINNSVISNNLIRSDKSNISYNFNNCVGGIVESNGIINGITNSKYILASATPLMTTTWYCLSGTSGNPTLSAWYSPYLSAVSASKPYSYNSGYFVFNTSGWYDYITQNVSAYTGSSGTSSTSGNSNYILIRPLTSAVNDNSVELFKTFGGTVSISAYNPGNSNFKIVGVFPDYFRTLNTTAFGHIAYVSIISAAGSLIKNGNYKAIFETPYINVKDTNTLSFDFDFNTNVSNLPLFTGFGVPGGVSVTYTDRLNLRNDVGSYYYDEFSNYISSAVLIDNMDIVLVGFIDSGTKISISITPSIPGNNSVNNAYRYSENGFNLDTSGYVSNKWGNNISIDSSYKPQIFGYSPTYLPSATYLQPGIPSLSAINFYQLNAGPVANSTTDTSGMFVTNANLFNSNLSNGFGITLTKYTSAVSGL